MLEKFVFLRYNDAEVMQMSFPKEITVSAITEAFTVYSPRGRVLEIKNRFAYGLSFCKSGEIVYTHKGRKTVSRPGVAVLLPMGEDYRLDGTGAGEFPLINFYLDRQDIREFIEIPLCQPETYLRDFEMLCEVLLCGRDRFRAFGIFYGILSRLATESEGEGDALVPILRYLETHYSDAQLSSSVLAEQGGISEVYMRKLFRERLHTSPKAYITELRMQRARQLLFEGRLGVGEIAAACGFTTVYHFSAAFRAATGQSPTKFRRENRKEAL